MQLNLLEFCTKINQMFSLKCSEYDKTWQKRSRIITTKLLILVILKTILSKNKPGYGNILTEVWDNCGNKNIDLPQMNSLAASSLCEARQKMPEGVFKILNIELIKLYQSNIGDTLWFGHRVFATDGSKLNMPTGLLNYGYKVSKDRGRHYPNGMMSCLYNLQDKLIYDCLLVSHNNERKCAIDHIKTLSPGDVVVYDRGYFSYIMARITLDSNVNAVFRVQIGGNVNGKIQEFADSSHVDQIIEYIPSIAVKHEIKKQGHKFDTSPIKLRLIKYTVKDQLYVCATTLLDQIKYPTECFCDLYHSRWGIEELYKVSKVDINIEEFHSKTERGVKQEIFGHALLINLARIFEKHCDINQKYNDDKLNNNATEDKLEPTETPKFQVNFKNCLAVVGRYLENIILGNVNTFCTWVDNAKRSIQRLKQKIRSNRSYPRISFKPRNSWTSFGRSFVKPVKH